MENNWLEIIAWKKREVQLNGWNAYELSVKDLMDVSTKKSEVAAIAEGLKGNLLEGDVILEGDIDHPDETLVVCYYCDNLDVSRRRLYA